MGLSSFPGKGKYEEGWKLIRQRKREADHGIAIKGRAVQVGNATAVNVATFIMKQLGLETTWSFIFPC